MEVRFCDGRGRRTPENSFSLYDLGRGHFTGRVVWVVPPRPVDTPLPPHTVETRRLVFSTPKTNLPHNLLLLVLSRFNFVAKEFVLRSRVVSAIRSCSVLIWTNQFLVPPQPEFHNLYWRVRIRGWVPICKTWLLPTVPSRVRTRNSKLCLCVPDSGRGPFRTFYVSKRNRRKTWRKIR